MKTVQNNKVPKNNFDWQRQFNNSHLNTRQQHCGSFEVKNKSSSSKCHHCGKKATWRKNVIISKEINHTKETTSKTKKRRHKWWISFGWLRRIKTSNKIFCCKEKQFYHSSEKRNSEFCFKPRSHRGPRKSLIFSRYSSQFVVP